MGPEESPKLQKIGNNYKLTLKSPSKCLRRKNFQQIAFHENEEMLIAIDTKGFGYLFELVSSAWCVKKLGPIGQSTFVAFNHIRKTELVIGLTTKEIKILNLNNISKACILKAHQVPPNWISFYRNYCLTASRKEAVIWDLETGKKIHQLRLETKESSIKKAQISQNGIIAVLYDTDVIQSWIFKFFSSENRISVMENGITNAKDFIFTENGRSLIVCGSKRRILVFNTKTWNLTAKFQLPDGNSVARRLFIIPQDVDYGCRNLAVLFEDRRFRFFDFSTQSFIPTADSSLDDIKKAVVSSGGQWLAAITTDGSLVISPIDSLIKPSKICVKKGKSVTEPVQSHGVHDHLKCIRGEFTSELEAKRLFPIVKKFGEYPERHRAVIWKNLLKLPENREEYLTLSEKLLLDTEVEMLQSWKLANKSKEMRLSVTIERLIQFCPLLGQTPYLPELIFPFIVAFEKNAVAGFEAVLMVLWNFCQRWFEYHPLPPINVLGIIENILREVDPALLEFYCQHEVTSTEYAWPLLKTTFSEVLEGKEWMILWDHLITLGRPSFLLICVVAYSICNKEPIIGILEKKEDFRLFFETQGPVPAKKIIKVAEKIDQELSQKNHPRRYLRDNLKFLPENGPYPPFLLKEYPEFLIGNIGTVKQMLNMKQEVLLIKEERKQVAKELEEKKLREESDYFLREIHQQRLNELQKCYNEQVKLTQMNLDCEREKLTKFSYENCLYSSKGITSKPISVKSKVIRTKHRGKTDSYAKLVHDVETLEEEVEAFLQGLRNSR